MIVSQQKKGRSQRIIIVLQQMWQTVLWKFQLIKIYVLSQTYLFLFSYGTQHLITPLFPCLALNHQTNISAYDIHYRLFINLIPSYCLSFVHHFMSHHSMLESVRKVVANTHLLSRLLRHCMHLCFQTYHWSLRVKEF